MPKLVCLIVVGWWALIPVSLARAREVESNLLNNGDLEGGCSAQGRLYADWETAKGWLPWYIPGLAADQSAGLYLRPSLSCLEAEYAPNAQVHGGHWSQTVVTSGGTHVAGMFQTLAVPPGAVLEFRAWVKGWSVTRSGDQLTRNAYLAKIGIDPTGAVESRQNAEGVSYAQPGMQVVWSETRGLTDEWQELVVRVLTDADRVTVWLWGAPSRPAVSNQAIWDDLRLTASGNGAEGLRWTATATSPGPTRTPNPTRTPTAIPPGRVCVQAFADRNGDGLMGAGDPAIPGFQYSLDGLGSRTGPPGCREVTPGEHRVETAWEGDLSTARTWSVVVQPGDTLVVLFGASGGAVPGPSAKAPATPYAATAGAAAVLVGGLLLARRRGS